MALAIAFVKNINDIRLLYRHKIDGNYDNIKIEPMQSSSILKDQKFNLSLQAIKLCRSLIQESKFELSHQVIDQVTHIQDCVATPDLKKADVTKRLAWMANGYS